VAEINQPTFLLIPAIVYLTESWYLGFTMSSQNVVVSDEQLAKLIDAYKTIQEFLGSVLPPNEIYTEEFLAGLRESEDDLISNRMNEVRSLDEFTA
jgi:hypothetical protein